MRPGTLLPSCPRLPWLLLLLAAALPPLEAQPGDADVRVVQTAAELTRAFADVAAHIELRSHLDLRTEAPSTAQGFLFRSFSGFKSFRVRRRAPCMRWHSSAVPRSPSATPAHTRACPCFASTRSQLEADAHGASTGRAAWNNPQFLKVFGASGFAEGV